MTENEKRQLWNESNLRYPGAQAIAAPTLISYATYHDQYIDAVIAAFPATTNDGGKSFEWSMETHQCDDQCHVHTAIAKEFTGREISAIEREFRKVIGEGAALSLLNDELLWAQLAAGAAPDGQGSPMNRIGMIEVTSRWAFEGAKAQWEKEAKRRGTQWALQNPIALVPLQPDTYAKWLNVMNTEGFELVRNKVTRQFVPEIKRFITELAIKDTPWSQIADDLRKTMQYGKRWEWVRIVRTEYMQAADKATMEQYKEMGVPLVRWNASRAGTTCSICLGYNGNLYSVDGGTKQYPEAPPLPHPQCRCNKVPVWGVAKYAAGATL